MLLVLNNILSSLTKIAFLVKQRSKNSGLILMPLPGTGGWWASPREVFMLLTYPEELWFSASGARNGGMCSSSTAAWPSPPFGIHGIAGTSLLTIAFCPSIFIPTAFHVVLHPAPLPFSPFYSIHHGFKFFFFLIFIFFSFFLCQTWEWAKSVPLPSLHYTFRNLIGIAFPLFFWVWKLNVHPAVLRLSSVH